MNLKQLEGIKKIINFIQKDKNMPFDEVRIIKLEDCKCGSCGNFKARFEFVVKGFKGHVKQEEGHVKQEETMIFERPLRARRPPIPELVERGQRPKGLFSELRSERPIPKGLFSELFKSELGRPSPKKREKKRKEE